MVSVKHPLSDQSRGAVSAQAVMADSDGLQTGPAQADSPTIRAVHQSHFGSNAVSLEGNSHQSGLQNSAAAESFATKQHSAGSNLVLHSSLKMAHCQQLGSSRSAASKARLVSSS